MLSAARGNGEPVTTKMGSRRRVETTQCTAPRGPTFNIYNRSICFACVILWPHQMMKGLGGGVFMLAIYFHVFFLLLHRALMSRTGSVMPKKRRKGAWIAFDDSVDTILCSVATSGPACPVLYFSQSLLSRFFVVSLSLHLSCPLLVCPHIVAFPSFACSPVHK